MNAPFERKNSRFTFMFVGYAMMILPDMPVAKTATLLRCDGKSSVKIKRHWTNKAVDAMDSSDVAQLVIDETSFKCGHSYVTPIIDATKCCVLDVEKDRNGGTISKFVEKLAVKGFDAERI